MNSKPVLPCRSMYHPVVVRAEPAGQFTAQPLGVPEICVRASTEKEAVNQVQQALARWLGALYWIPLDVSISEQSNWPPEAGHAKDDPDFEAYREEIRRFRQEVDNRECSASSSTPTT